jgi:SAM-dependent methyltransferase
MSLTPAALDEYARTYYLSDEIADIDIEERAQRLSAPRVAAAVGDARRVLDMGYGTGEMAGELLARGLDAEVVEGSPLLAARARREHPELVVHEAMFEGFDPGPVYDAVLALHVMEHVDAPSALMERVRGWLAPGGSLVVVVPNRHSLHRRLAVLMGIQGELDDLSPRDHLVGHRRVYGLDTLGADLRAAGFAVSEEFGFTLKTVPNAMMLDWPPDLMDALTNISPDLPPGLLANIGVRAVAAA